MTAVAFESVTSLPQLLDHQARRLGPRVVLRTRGNGAWPGITWRTLADRVATLAAALCHHGLRPGDRVVLVGANSPEWVMADLAIMHAGAITVPAYTTNTAADHAHILNNVGATWAVVLEDSLLPRLLPALVEAGTATVITPKAITPPAGVQALPWTRLLDTDAPPLPLPDLSRDDTACIIHTSGTSGRPRGIRLTHGNILFNGRIAGDLLAQVADDDPEVFLSVLPFSHAYERSCGLYLPLALGAEIAVAPGLDALARTMAEVRPTVMLCVPRLLEVLRTRLLTQMRKGPAWKRALAEEALTLGRQRQTGTPLTPAQRLRDSLLNTLVRRTVRQRLGGRLKALVSGGARLDPAVETDLAALGVPVLQGYGQTEAGPLICCNPPRGNRPGTVGPAPRDVAIAIAADGEIRVRGPNVMPGYWNDAEATAQVLQDGWLHTGDVGHLDPAGHLVITDRKKDILVLSGGDNIAPARVEGILLREPEIHQALVCGDGRPHLVALLVAEEAVVTQHGPEPEALHRALAPAVARANQALSTVETVRAFTVLAAPFSIEDGSLTPTLKLRRHEVLRRHGALLRGLYG